MEYNSADGITSANIDGMVEILQRELEDTVPASYLAQVNIISEWSSP